MKWGPAALSLLLLVCGAAAQSNNLPVEIIVLVDDSFGVSENNWQATQSFLRSLIQGTTGLVAEETWQLGMITFSGRVIMSLGTGSLEDLVATVNNAPLVNSNSQAGWDVAYRELLNSGRLGTASIFLLMPSVTLRYDENFVSSWVTNIRDSYHSHFIVAGMGINAQQSSFFNTIANEGFFIEETYQTLIEASVQNSILEKVFIAASVVEAPDAPGECLALDLVFVLDGTAAFAVEQIKAWLLNTISFIVNIERNGVNVGVVQSGNTGQLLFGIYDIYDQASARDAINQLQMTQQSVNDLPASLNGVKAFFDQQNDENERPVQVDVIVVLTYQEPVINNLYNAMLQNGLAAARYIAVGVETDELTLNSIATVSSWKIETDSFEDLAQTNVGSMTSKRICSAGIPVCFYTADVVLVVDAGSIDAVNNWNNVRLLLVDIVQSYFYGYNGVRFAVILYGTSAELRYTLEDSQGTRYPKLSQFADQLRSLGNLQLTATPDPSSALALARQVLDPQAAGNRAERNVVLWIPSELTSSMEPALNEEVSKFIELEVAVGVVGLGLSPEGQAVATRFSNAIALDDLVYFISNLNMLSDEALRVREIFEQIGPIICRVYKTDFTKLGEQIKGEKGQKGEVGPQGFQGDRGDNGAEGGRGLSGQQGMDGDIGFPGQRGAKGSQGGRGVSGQQGAKGARGDNGDAGLNGINGQPGLDGPTGPKGQRGVDAAAQGEKGNTGFGIPGSPGNPGDPGERGPTGIPGAKGDKGVSGRQGDQGNVGRTGDFGDKGVKGTSGQPGSRGDNGEKGLKGGFSSGSKGVKGQPGDAGARGADGGFGLPGSPGSPGLPGDSGIPGGPGEVGEKGNRGSPGANGVPGSPGDRGDQGETVFGPPGTPGQKGESGVAGLDGINGVGGANGVAGAKGRKGQKGIRGTDGQDGPKGVVGALGETGSTGDMGTPGRSFQGQSGDTGDKGAQGPKGIKGTRGQDGNQGIKGAKGLKGFTGSTGATGRQGSSGFKGRKGITGPPGNDGVPGQSFVGLKGPKGFRGSPGAPGNPGLDGVNGANGNPGAKGDRGDGGIPGVAGSRGPTGFDGSPGLPGDRGAPGLNGDAGRGLPGAPGLPGDFGDAGQVGDNGINGIPGSRGDTGAAGLNGVPGTPGSAGAVGDRGSNGFPGIPGGNGFDGLTGATGFTGQAGIPGANGQRGNMGDTGVQGSFGNQGPQGPKGFSGSSSRGQKGQPGPQGLKGFQGAPGPGGVNYVDECQSFNPCNQLCVDTYDSYYCACRQGYQQSGRNEECPPVNKRKKRQANSCRQDNMDVVVVFDKSVWTYIPDQVIAGVMAFLQVVGLCESSSSVRVGIVEYDSIANLVTGFTERQTLSTIEGILRDISISRESVSDASIAFNEVLRQTESGGSLQQRGPMVVALFTAIGFYSYYDNVLASSTALKDRGFPVFAFGTQYADLGQLQTVATASSGGEQYAAFNAEFSEYASAITSAVSNNPVLLSSTGPTVPPQPTRPPPSQGDCFGADLDIALLVDATWWTGDFDQFRQGVSNIIGGFPSCNTESIRFSVISFTDAGVILQQLTTDKARVQNVVENMALVGGWSNDIRDALNAASQSVFTQSASSTRRVIMVFSAYNQDDAVDLVASMKSDYTFVAYGFRRGAESNEWLNSIPSDSSLSFIAPDPNVFTMVSDMEPLVDNLRNNFDIDPPAPVGPDPLDLAIILDASGSTDANFDRLKRFARDVIQFLNVGPNNVRIAAVRFSQTASVEFGLTRYTTLNDVDRALGNVRRIGGRTNIAAALRVTNELVFTSQGRNNVPQVALLLTDGYANEEVSRTVYDASILRGEGVHILGVQVHDLNRMMSLTVPLESIATSVEYVYKYGSHMALLDALNRIDVQRGILALAYVEYDVAPQPDDYYCRDTHHGLMCFCRTSPYRPINSSFCEDVDECGMHNGGCQHRCINTDGSFRCECNSGYELSADEKSCLDVNECEGNQVCTAGTQCLNYVGGFICVDPFTTDPSTGAQIAGAVVGATVSPGIIVAISLSAAIGTVALAVVLALAGRSIYRRTTSDVAAESNEQAPSANRGSAYGTVRSKLSMTHVEEAKAVL